MKRLPLLLLLAPGLLAADVVYLKGAGIFTGRIVEQNEERMVFDFGDGTIGIPMDRIEMIVKERSALDEYDARAGKLEPQDVNGWRRLAQWARTKGLAAQARAAYRKVLAVAPDDPEAREGLGFVLIDGRWLTEEESYRARGFVWYEGEWLTPEELHLAQADAARQQERDDEAKAASDAQFAANMDRLRAEEAQKRAQEEWDRISRGPIYWGGFGYGVRYWPGETGSISQPANPASRTPAGDLR